MISSTWSQITHSDKHNPLINSPMTALTSSPLIRNSSAPLANSTSGASGVNFKQHLSFQQSPEIIDSSNSSSPSDLTTKLKGKAANDTMLKSRDNNDPELNLYQQSAINANNPDKIGK